MLKNPAGALLKSINRMWTLCKTEDRGVLTEEIKLRFDTITEYRKDLSIEDWYAKEEEIKLQLEQIAGGHCVSPLCIFVKN